ncbi:hypothetical protein AgCh_017509 [Apium graveolens]
MDDNNDFTFCKVTGPVNVEVFEAHKIVPDIGNIDLKDELRNGDKTDKAGGVLSKNDVSASEASKDEESAPSATQEPKNVVKKPVPRAKVPFEKGYSQMDWLKLTRTHPDLAGLKGQSNKRLISLKEVKLHKTEEDSMWTVLNGRVYNITPYMKFHPGGIATVHPKCQTRPYPPNEDNPPDSRTGDPKLLGAKCRMTPKFSNEDTR